MQSAGTVKRAIRAFRRYVRPVLRQSYYKRRLVASIPKERVLLPSRARRSINPDSFDADNLGDRPRRSTSRRRWE